MALLNKYLTSEAADWNLIPGPGQIIFVDGKQYVGDGETALKNLIPNNIINIHISIPEAAISTDLNNQFPYLDSLVSYNDANVFDWYISFPPYIEDDWDSLEDYQKNKEAYLEAAPNGGIYDTKNILFFLEEVAELKTYAPFYLDIKVVKK